MKFTSVDAPANRQRDAIAKDYNRSAKGKARESRRGAKRNPTRKVERLEHYLSRPFVAWDGEGVTDPETGFHSYTLLANSAGGSISAPPPGIGTVRALEFLLSEAARVGDAVHVIYGGSYDTNMIFKDLTRTELERVYRSRTAYVRGYRIQWRPGKMLHITDMLGSRKITLYDVVSFFQCSFVKACDSYLGPDWYDRERIVKEKARRGTFTVEESESVAAYNDSELINLVRLCDELRVRLHRAGLRVKRWDGPGAVASALLTDNRIKDHMAVSPDGPAEAARYAYAGGRFEILKFGHSLRSVYQYDLKSAYPSALRHVPCLRHGEWVHHNVDPGDLPFALYRVEWDRVTTTTTIDVPPGPHFVRYKNGTVAYPFHGQGWYWNPEVKAAREIAVQTGKGTYEVLEVWEFVSECDHKPFAFIDPLYLKRQALQRAGDGAHVGVKLGLNSLYGKLAQQVGWEEGPPLRIPPFHQLEWAGFTTSHCRAEILRACWNAPDDVIAIETDAIFSRVPLPLTLGDGLGEWELTEYADLTYFQSGMYYGTTVDGKCVEKTRGTDLGTLTREAVLEAMATYYDVNEGPYADAKSTRFVGAGVALSQSWERWRRWETTDRKIRTAPGGKRVHGACWSGDGESCKPEGERWSGWHAALCMLWGSNVSCEFPIEWINPNPEMIVNEEGVTFHEARADRESDWI